MRRLVQSKKVVALQEVKEEDTQESFEEKPDIQKGYHSGSSSEENEIPVVVPERIRTAELREEASPSEQEHLDLIESTSKS